MLVMLVTVVGAEELPATTAFASAWFPTHHTHLSPGKPARKSNAKSNQEED
jgi:hypothetical protein